MKYLMDSVFLTGANAQIRYRNSCVAKTTLRHTSVLVPVESLNGDDTGSKRLRIYYWNAIKLYTATAEELPVLIRAGRKAMKNQNRPARFQGPKSYTNAKMLLGKPRAVIFDHRTESSLNFVELFNTLMPHTPMTSICLLQAISGACVCSAMFQSTESHVGRLSLKVVRFGISEKCRRFSRPLIPHSGRCW